MSQTSKKPRKQARQARSKRTVAAILRAAAHILKADGMAGLTTNHVAQQANISVGSVYQYFPNKQAILLELLHEQLARAQALRPALLNEASGVTLQERITASVQWHLDSRRTDPALFARLFEVQRDSLFASERAQFDRFHLSAVLAGLQHHRAEIRVADLETAALIMSQFLLTATQSAPASKPSLLDDPGYGDQIAAAILAYLTSE